MHLPNFKLGKIIAAAIPFIFILFAGECAAQPESGISKAIEQLLEKGPARYIGAEGHGYTSEQIDTKLTSYYRQRNLKPIWINDQGPNERARVLLSFLDSASAEGLNPEDYRTEWIHGKWESTNIDDLAKLEILLTLELSQYTADIRAGRMNPKKVDPVLFASARDKEIDMAELAGQALGSTDLKTFLNSQSPQHVYYTSMITALDRYRKIAENSGWPLVSEGAVLKPGMTDSRIPMIRKRLAVTNDYTGTDLSSHVFDKQFEDAVKNFQKRHYLNADGVIGNNTVAAMNIPVEKFARQVCLPGIILQGTATLEYAIRELINREAGANPSQINSLYARFSGMVIPGTAIKVILNEKVISGNNKKLYFCVLNHQGDYVIKDGFADFSKKSE